MEQTPLNTECSPRGKLTRERYQTRWLGNKFDWLGVFIVFSSIGVLLLHTARAYSVVNCTPSYSIKEYSYSVQSTCFVLSLLSESKVANNIRKHAHTKAL